MGKWIGALNIFLSVQGLKSIGYVQLILPAPPTSSSSGKTPRTGDVVPVPTPKPYLALGFAALAFVAAFSIPYLHR